MAKPDFSAKRRKVSANVEIFPQTGSGQERTLWDPAEATRSQSQMKMMRRVQNEMFTFKIDSETALVGSTLER